MDKRLIRAVCLYFQKIVWSATWFVHRNFTLGMLVNTKRKGVLIEIVNRVEMLEESITDQEEVFVLSWESAFVDNEVAFFMA